MLKRVLSRVNRLARHALPSSRHRAFTLLELLTAIVIILILAVLIVPAVESIRGRVERINCTANLHTLYVGAAAYLQAHGYWPQVNPNLIHDPHHAYDEAWIEALMPYAISRKSWICPTIEHELGGVDYTQPENYRSDYVAMPFDAKAITPTRWSTQPWFVERGNVHGNGNLLILANGTVTDMNTLRIFAGAGGQ